MDIAQHRLLGHRVARARPTADAHFATLDPQRRPPRTLNPCRRVEGVGGRHVGQQQIGLFVGRQRPKDLRQIAGLVQQHSDHRDACRGSQALAGMAPVQHHDVFRQITCLGFVDPGQQLPQNRGRLAPAGWPHGFADECACERTERQGLQGGLGGGSACGRHGGSQVIPAQVGLDGGLGHVCLPLGQILPVIDQVPGSRGDLVDLCQGFCQHSLWILWIYDSRYFQIAPWLTGLLAMVCLSAQIGLTPFTLVCQDVSFKVVGLYPSSLQVPICVACITMASRFMENLCLLLTRAH